MRKILSFIGISIVVTIICGLELNAQVFKTPLSYLDYIGQQQESITKDYWDYTSSIAHSTNARKVERRRLELLKTTQNAITKISAMPDCNGDVTLRDSMISYLKISYHLLNEDYAKLVDLEEIAEQSYDAMEAYMLAKEKASDKLEAASDKLNQVVKKFASNNNITLVESENKISKKLAKAGLVFKYYNPIYLIFFKNYKQEFYLIDAVNRTDFVGIEQNKNKLVEVSSIGLRSLDTIKSFKGDNTLINSCKKLLSFYNDEASKKIPIIADFYLKKENFDKIKSSFESKRDNERTKEDFDQYNKAIKEFNQIINEYNRVNKEMNDSRNRYLNDWNSEVSRFFDRYVPKNK